MISGLGVLGYGVGGIEAEAVLLGQPLYQPLPRVVGVRLHGELPRGSTATDLVLVISQMLRKHGVVGAFVEFAGDGLGVPGPGGPGHDRQHVAGVRRDHGPLPGRRRDPRIPAAHRPRRGPRAPGRGVHQGAGPVALAGRRSRVRRDPGAGPRHRGAQRRGTPAAAGPGASSADLREELPERLPDRRPEGGTSDDAFYRRRDRDRRMAGRRPSGPARWPSRPSPAAPTPPTRP